MAKVSGISCIVTIGGNTITNDVTSVNLNTPYGVQDVTGLDKAAVERLLLLADGTGTVNGVFNTTSLMSHATLKVPGSKAFILGYPGATATFTAVTTDYALARGQDGSLTWSVPFALSSGTAVAWT